MNGSLQDCREDGRGGGREGEEEGKMRDGGERWGGQPRRGKGEGEREIALIMSIYHRSYS